MSKKVCERKAGYLAFWAGNFKDIEDFYKYIQSFYCIFEGEEDEYNPEYNFLEKDFNKELEKIFSVEKEWKEEFEEMFEEAFNRFEYDFGVTFDEDFQVCGNSEEPTDELEVLFKDWEELIEPVKKFLGKDKFDKKYNCFFGIPSCKYCGIIPKISNEWGEIEFLGNVEENTFSTDMAEEYNC
jgi:hypothetical protein